MASYSYVLKMVAAYSSETLVPNTILRDATSQDTVISNKAVLKLLRHNYEGRCDKIGNVIIDLYSENLRFESRPGHRLP